MRRYNIVTEVSLFELQEACVKFLRENAPNGEHSAWQPCGGPFLDPVTGRWNQAFWWD